MEEAVITGVAFSPGFTAPAGHRGKPPIFVSHGTPRDKVLPIGALSRRIVPDLERDGYEVRYREFDSPRTVPRPVARDALRELGVEEVSDR